MKKSKSFNWESVREKVNSFPWAADLLECVKRDYEEHRRLWQNTPTLFRTEWAHYYFCKDCGVRLVFDITKPSSHECPKCLTEYSGWPYDGTWHSIVHSTIVSNMERAAILAHMPNADKEYKDYIHDNIMFYAENYDKYTEYGRHAGIGKVYPQVLTEAIFVISIERVIRLASDLDIFNEQELKKIGDLFFRPALELIKPQINKIHNIHAWMQAAVAACASFLDDLELLKESIESELGWLDQLKRGTTQEGIWYEISSGYHYYTIRALLSHVWIAYENDINLFDNPEFQKLVKSYVPLVFDDGTFPAWNDSWFGTDIFSSASAYEELSMTDSSYAPLLAWIYSKHKIKPYGLLNQSFGSAKTETGHARASLSALLYGSAQLQEAEEPECRSIIYEDAGIAVLQNERLRVILKSTKDGGGHDHNDKNSIEIYAGGEYLSYDPGTTGYGIPFTKEWSRTSLAHNMVCVNYQRQVNSTAKIVEYTSDSVVARADDAYPGVSLQRGISLKENGFDDTFTVECGETSQIDWIFHFKGDVGSELVFEDMEKFTEENGYDQLFNMRGCKVDSDFCIWFNGDRQKLVMNFIGEAGTEVVIGNCYGINKVDILSFVMLRRSKRKTVFSHSSVILLEDNNTHRAI